MRKWHSVAVAIAGILAMACGGDSSGPSGNKLAVDDVVGVWTFHVQAKTSCGGAAGGGDFLLDLTNEDRAPEGSTLNVITATWGFEPQQVNGLADGTVNLSSGDAAIRILKGTTNGALISGVMDSDHTFTGILQDPAPGLNPAFVLNPCQFQMTGERG